MFHNYAQFPTGLSLFLGLQKIALWLICDDFFYDYFICQLHQGNKHFSCWRWRKSDNPSWTFWIIMKMKGLSKTLI